MLSANTETSSTRKNATDYLRELSGQLLRLQDEERRRISRELHDSTGQTLCALKLALVSLQNSVITIPNVSEQFEQIFGLLDQATAELRTTSHLLYPPTLEEAGFASAAQWFVHGFTQRSGIETEVHFCSNPALSKDQELVFFRILQESLTNVLRHSGSKSVHITLTEVNRHAVLSVRDYGTGIPSHVLQAFKGNGMGLGIGLAGMKQRVLDMGGHMSIASGKYGTIVTAKLPLGKTYRVK